MLPQYSARRQAGVWNMSSYADSSWYLETGEGSFVSVLTIEHGRLSVDHFFFFEYLSFHMPVMLSRVIRFTDHVTSPLGSWLAVGSLFYS